jgi:hypothetical protein
VLRGGARAQFGIKPREGVGMMYKLTLVTAKDGALVAAFKAFLRPLVPLAIISSLCAAVRAGYVPLALLSATAGVRNFQPLPGNSADIRRVLSRLVGDGGI